MQKPIILASASPRRKMLLKSLGIKFSAMKPKVQEKIDSLTPEKLAIKLAKEKVFSVTSKIKRGIIIGVDTIVVFDKKILGKPNSRAEAYKMLRLLSNQTHKVISGLYLLSLPEKKSVKGYEATEVTFRRLTSYEINEYLKTNEAYDKAGGYGIQSTGGKFVKKINGCYFNVVGLPITKLIRLLKKLGVNLRPAPP
jgi:septum formation protein